MTYGKIAIFIACVILCYWWLGNVKSNQFSYSRICVLDKSTVKPGNVLVGTQYYTDAFDRRYKIEINCVENLDSCMNISRECWTSRTSIKFIEPITQIIIDRVLFIVFGLSPWLTALALIY